MKTFASFLTEAEATPERLKPQDGPKPFKEPESNPPQTGQRKIRKRSSAGPGTTAEPQTGSRASRTRTSALRPEYFDTDGNLRPEAARRFAERRAGAGYSRPGQSLTPERKAALDKVNDLFKRFDAGDADAAAEVGDIENKIIQKHGAANKHPSFREVTTGTSPTPSDSTTRQLRDMQGRKGQAPLDPALQQAASDRLSGQSTSQTIDNPGRPEQSVMDKTRAAADARRAGVSDAGARTPRPGVRTDDILDAIRNVPDEPKLPKVTGGQPRPTDRTGMSQAEFKGLLQRGKNRPPLFPPTISDLPDAPKQGRASLPLPSPTRSQTVKTVQNALNRNATQQGAATVATGQQPANAWQRYLKSTPGAQQLVGGLKWGGRALAALGAISDYHSGVADAKAAGAGPVRQTLRGVTRAVGGFGGGLLGGSLGATVGTAKGAIGGPLAIGTGIAGGLYGGAQGASLGASGADAVFRTLGGETKQQVSQKDAAARAKQINQGIGQSYSYGTGDTAIIRGADGKERVGQRSTSNGTTVYTAPYRPETNPIDRIGRNLPFVNNILKGYYQRKDDAERKARVKKQKTKFYDSIGSQPSNNYKLPSIPADGSGTGP